MPKKEKYVPRTGMPFTSLFIISSQRDNISPIIPVELKIESLQKHNDTTEDDIISMKELLKMEGGHIATPEQRDILVKALIENHKCIELKQASIRIKFKAIISKYYYECIYMDTISVEEWSDRIVALSFFRSLVESDTERVGNDKINKVCAQWDFVNYMLQYSRTIDQKEVELGINGNKSKGKIGVLNGKRLIELYTIKEVNAKKPKEFASFLRKCVCNQRNLSVGPFHKVKDTTWVPDLMKHDAKKKKKLTKIIHPYVQILRELGISVGGNNNDPNKPKLNDLMDDDDIGDEKGDDIGNYDPERDGIDGWTIIDEEKDGQIKYNLNNPWYILNDNYEWELLPKRDQNKLKKEAKLKSEEFEMINKNGKKNKVLLEPETYTCGVIFIDNIGIENKNNAIPIICAKPQNGKIHEINVVKINK